MIGFLLRRLLGAVPVVLGVALAVFLLLHLVPGDPVELMLGDSARPADRTALRQALGLDKPVGEQLLDYVGGLAGGDLGQSLFSRRPVAEIIAERLPATAELAAAPRPWGLRLLDGGHTDRARHGLIEVIAEFADAVTRPGPDGARP